MRLVTLPKNIVAAGLAKKAEVQLAYAIGVAQPVSVRIDTFGTGTVAESKLEKQLVKPLIFACRDNPNAGPQASNLPSNSGLWSHGTYRY